MFSLRLSSIRIQNTITPSPNTKNPFIPCSYSFSTYSRCHSQTHRFPSQPLTIIKHGNAPWNVALRNADQTTPNADEWPEPELEPFPAELRPEMMPKHVALIIDGHGRWAKLRGLPLPEGAKAGVRPLKRFVRQCSSWGIKVATIYIFSTENWTRPKVEVDTWVRLFETTIASNIENLQRYGIRMRVIGDITKLPGSLQRMINYVEETTKDNLGLHLTVAFGYGGRYDIVQACKGVAQKVKDGLVQLEDINEKHDWTGIGD